MNGLFIALQGAVAQGVLWGVMVLGVYITFRLLNIADMTVDGSFALGGCACALMILNHGWHPVPALLFSMGVGALAGLVTGMLHTFFEIPSILAGILTQISLWSINLRIMGGKSNIPLLQVKGKDDVLLPPVETIFTILVDKTGLTHQQCSLMVGIIIVVVLTILLYWFFGTEVGSALRATGNNEDMVRALGVSTKIMKVLALMISNGLVGLSGGLVCQNQKSADIGMGTGAIVIGLAAIVIGEVLLGRLRSFGSKLISAAVGAVVYFLIRAIVLRLGMPANDMKMISAVIVGAALCVPVMIDKYRAWKSYSEEGEVQDANDI